MTPKERAAMQMALEALETLRFGDSYKTHNAATALREALAEPTMRKTTRDEKIVRPGVYEVPAEQAEQEPMYISESCAQRGCACHYSVEVDGEPVTVYAAPVRTKDLTDDEIRAIRFNWERNEFAIDFARAVIAADREKNRG